MELWIKIGGVYHDVLIVFHLMFWRLFNWKDDLQSLSFLNKAIMPVLNNSLTLVFVIFSTLSFVHSQELLTTALGNSLLILIALFWFARAVQQVIYFKLKHWGSWAFTLFFLLGAILYGVPAIYVI